MYDTETLEKYAEVLLWGLARGRRERQRKSEFVLVRFDLPGLPLAEELCGRLHDMGMIPVPRMQPTPRMEHDFHAMANNKRLTTLIPGERDLYSHLGGCITIIAPESLTHLAAIEPERIAMAQAARRPLQDIARLREDMGVYGWTLCVWPTAALAGQAGLTTAEYADEVRRACLLGEADPVAAWTRVAKQAGEIRSKLDALGDATLHVEADGTDLRLRVGRMRRWVGVTGRNIPSFEVYVSPDWRSAEGVYTADLPSFRSGNIVQGVRLEIRQGRVVRLTAQHGENFAARQLASDPGAAMLGEFALVDRRFSRITRFMANTLYDENHGGPHGSMHVALGQSYANTFAGPLDELTADARRDLGFNRSSLHWDLVSTTPRKVTAVTPEGRRAVIYEDGEFRL